MYRFLCSLIGIFVRLVFRIEINGLGNVPKDSAAILCANHISNWDPLILQGLINRHIYFMAKDELFHVFFVSFILKKIGAIPVKRTGSDLTAIKLALKTVKEGKILGIFPTGQREKVKGEGEVKSGVGLISGKTEVPVLPIHISANFRIFSKVVVNIGKPKKFVPENGEKLSVEVAERLSKEIYAEIKSLA